MDNNKDYILANITENDILTISEYEKDLSEKKNSDIVLIAYQPGKKAEV